MRDTSSPGAIAPPRYSPSAETASKLIPVPKSTTTQALATALVSGDRVDEPVGADLERVVDPDRHSRLHPGADRQALGAQIALRELFVLSAQRRHHGGDADGIEVVQAEPAQRQQAADPLRQLVPGCAGASLKTPVLSQALAIEGAEMGLGVADVHREEHSGDYRLNKPMAALLPLGPEEASMDRHPLPRHRSKRIGSGA